MAALELLDTAYLCKKFDDSSFSYALVIFRALKRKVDQYVVRRLGLATSNLRTKFQISTITRNEDMKGTAKCKNSSSEPPGRGT